MTLQRFPRLFSFKAMSKHGVVINPNSKLARKYRLNLPQDQIELNKMLTQICREAVVVFTDCNDFQSSIESNLKLIKDFSEPIYDDTITAPIFSVMNTTKKYNALITKQRSEAIQNAKRRNVSLEKNIVASCKQLTDLVTQAYVLATETTAVTNEIARGEPGATKTITSSAYIDNENQLLRRKPCVG